jgi:putative flavoprotein involved in K+ transport
MESIETLIVGAGQAGLALSHELAGAGREHVLLERGRTVERWRSERWDSLTLLSPNWMTRLPGQHYDGDDPNGFMHHQSVVQFFESYAASFSAPVQQGIAVRAIDHDPDRTGYVVSTTHGRTWHAHNVVVATGMFQRPHIAGWGAELPPDIAQVHSSGYRNPDQLPPGAVLVVGSGASGFQIAEELQRHGRRVFFSVGRHERPPRRYRGRDVMSWIEQMGIFDQAAATPADHWQHPGSGPTVAPPSPALTGVDGGHDLDPHRLAQDGVVLLGHINGMTDDVLAVAPDLAENLRTGDASYAAWQTRIDAYIAAHGIVAPEADPTPALPLSLAEAQPLAHLDVKAAGVSAVVWATGFRTDFSWIHVPVFLNGMPAHQRGVTAVPGIYFLRIAPFYKRRATLIDGLEEDAGFLAEVIEVTRSRREEPVASLVAND